MWKQGIFGAVLAAFLGYVAWVAWIGPTRHQIEWDIATRVNQVLEHSGLAAVLPVVEGRDVELQGQVGSVAEAARAERLVQRLRGVRGVHSRLAITGATAAREGGDR